MEIFSIVNVGAFSNITEEAIINQKEKLITFKVQLLHGDHIKPYLNASKITLCKCYIVILIHTITLETHLLKPEVHWYYKTVCNLHHITKYMYRVMQIFLVQG